MVTPMTAVQMRSVIVDRFQQYGAGEVSGGDLEERVRIDEGRVVAYCYRAANLFAMWMVDIGLVQFYDDQGNMLETLELISPALQKRRAA